MDPAKLMINWASVLATYKHSEQKRKDRDKTPYIVHPKRVENLVHYYGNVEDPEIRAAAMLHDTLEDTRTSPKELELLFGERVRTIVEELSDDKSLPKQERKRLQIEHANLLSPEAALIKLADKIANIEDIMLRPPEDWNSTEKLEYVKWANEVINNCPTRNEDLYRYFVELSNLIKEQKHCPHCDWRGTTAELIFKEKSEDRVEYSCPECGKNAFLFGYLSSEGETGSASSSKEEADDTDSSEETAEITISCPMCHLDLHYKVGRDSFASCPSCCFRFPISRYYI